MSREKKKKFRKYTWQNHKKDMRRNWALYLVVLPVIAYFFVFHYMPMYGALIAFQDYRPSRGFGVDWVGFKHFSRFFKNPFLYRLIRNTLMINVLELVFGFPAPIVLALILNEMKNSKFKTLAQTAMYLPNFISSVIICGLIVNFCLTDGLFNDIIVALGGKRVSLLQTTKYYRGIYVGSGIWQTVGWGTIIYVAALAGVDHELYDAASVDGAGKWKQTIHVTIPGIAPTVITMLILRMGSMLSVGHERTMLLYNEAIYEVSDVISTYVYRQGMVSNQYSYSTAVNMFSQAVNIILLFTANKISRKVSETSLW